MRYAYKERKQFGEINNEERIIVKRNISHGRFLFAFGCFSNLVLYGAFFTGIYNFRTTELLNMRSIPLPIKLAITTTISSAITYKIYERVIYEPELYKLALKYRGKFDENYKERIEVLRYDTD